MRNLTRLRSLTIVLTSACNLRCSYCYQNAKRPGKMAWPTLETALGLVLGSSRRTVSVTFTGGEPLLHFRLIELAVDYVRRYKRKDQAIGFHLLTNGMLLGAREVEFLARANFDVRISLDGIAAVQALRGLQTFRVLDGLLDRLHRDQPRWFEERVSVGAVITAHAVPSLADSVAYLLSKGVRDIVLGPAVTFQPDWGRDRIEVLEDRMARVYRLSIRHFRQTGRVPVRLFRNAHSEEDVSDPSPTLCGAGRSDYLTIDVDGEVSGCVLFARSNQRFPETPLGRALATLHAGRIDEPELAARLRECRRRIEATGVFTNRRSKRSSYGRCATCRYRRGCSLCPMVIVHQPGNADPNRVPDFACAFQRVAGKFRRRFPPVPA